MENILDNEHIQKIVLRANHHITGETVLALRGTKAIRLEDMSNTDEEYDKRETWGELLLSAHDRPMTSVDVTTWSSLNLFIIYSFAFLSFICYNTNGD